MRTITFLDLLLLCVLTTIIKDGSKKPAELREGEGKSWGPGKGTQLHFASEKYPIRLTGCSYTSHKHLGSMGGVAFFFFLISTFFLKIEEIFKLNYTICND